VSKPWVVLKFGGTSVATALRWERIAVRVRELAPDRRVWVVVSALAKVTDLLKTATDQALSGHVPTALDDVVHRHHELAGAVGLHDADLEPALLVFADTRRRLEGIRLTRDATPKLRAEILASGELASSRLGVRILAHMGIQATWVDASALLITHARARESDSDRYLEARVLVQRQPERAEELTGQAEVVMAPGFIARTPEGELCLLGRGGSDTSAAGVAAVLGAERLEIWTDVHGLFTADPSLVPVARLIRRIGHREAQELAAMGGKVLHPRSLGPVSQANIPVHVRSIDAPAEPGTLIEEPGEEHPVVTAVTHRKGVTLLSVATLAMFETPGYLARVFETFEEHGFSVDLVATSQTAVSVTLDRSPGDQDGRTFAALVRSLESLGTVTIVHPCAVVSIVGRRIRAVLNEIGPALDVFQERPVHLVSDSAEDLNLSFVVDEADGPSMVAKLHARLFSGWGEDPKLGPTWEMLARSAGPESPPWWKERASELIQLVADGRARYVYHLGTVREQIHRLLEELPAVDVLYYAMKANAYPGILRAIAEEGIGFECVSAAEVRCAREHAGSDTPLLFTPNFCPIEEYREAFNAGAEVVVDGPQVFDLDPKLFAGRGVGLRIDPGQGVGHHTKVVTAGAATKFGLSLADLELFREAARRHGVRVTGIHAHVGSGILDPSAWVHTANILLEAMASFPDATWIDLGGGLGVPEQPGQHSLDLARLQRELGRIRTAHPRVSLRLEPGRFLVSEAGVLVAPVTQVRTKGGVHLAGVATGMNSLLRPALYGAWHRMHNLSRLGEAPARTWQIVGPICESADVLGRDRRLPDPRPGDVILIENAGAYGAVMASHYNLREPAEEVMLT
jgi:bifunctional diaminopimelate decarboxylase / aspartate kinase